MKLGIASADMLLSTAPTNKHGIDLWGGAGWARIGQYLDYYADTFDEVIVGKLWKEADKGLSVQTPDGERHHPDVVLLQRMMMPHLSIAINYGKANGQVIINDVDDWFWGIDPSNHAFAGTHPKTKKVHTDSFGVQHEVLNQETLANYGNTLASSSLVTVSTPYLAERLSNRLRCPIEVIPNYVDLKRFRPVVQQPSVPVFGWAGSTAHRSGDLETVRGVLKPALLDGQIKLHHSGDGSIQHHTTFAAVMGLPAEAVSTSPLVSSTEYPSILTFDVGMIPLRDTPFNHAKSDIKGLEYAACGIPFIASSSDGYNRLWEDWGGCFHLAKRPKDWVSGIKRYTNFDNRQADARTLLDRVQDRDIAFGVQQWTELLGGGK